MEAIDRPAGGEESRGVVYLAFGAPYLAMALVSAASLRASNPSVPICMLTNVTEHPPDVSWWGGRAEDRWVYIEDRSEMNRHYKTDMLAITPFDRTLFLDCDTFVVGDVDRIWGLLDHFDLVLRPVPRPGDRSVRILQGSLRLGDVTHFNTGVFGFRRTDATADFFRRWNDGFRAMKLGVDQPAFVEALFTSRARLYPLRSEFNEEEVWKLSREERERVVIWHYKCRTADRRTRRLVRSALTWFGATDADRDQLEALFRGRRRLEGGPVRRRIRSLLTELRGPVSLRPARLVGAARWREMTSPRVSPAAPVTRSPRPLSAPDS